MQDIRFNYATKENVNDIKLMLITLKKDYDKNQIILNRAISHGDLRENSEFDFHSKEQKKINNKMNIIKEFLKNVILINPSKDERIEIMSKTEIINVKTNKNMIFTIVPHLLEDYKKGLISIKSPISVALYGKAVNEDIILNDNTFKILKIYK